MQFLRQLAFDQLGERLAQRVVGLLAFEAREGLQRGLTLAERAGLERGASRAIASVPPDAALRREASLRRASAGSVRASFKASAAKDEV